MGVVVGVVVVAGASVGMDMGMGCFHLGPAEVSEVSEELLRAWARTSERASPGCCRAG